MQTTSQLPQHTATYKTAKAQLYLSTTIPIQQLHLDQVKHTDF